MWIFIRTSANFQFTSGRGEFPPQTPFKSLNPWHRSKYIIWNAIREFAFYFQYLRLEYDWFWRIYMIFEIVGVNTTKSTVWRTHLDAFVVLLQATVYSLDLCEHSLESYPPVWFCDAHVDYSRISIFFSRLLCNDWLEFDFNFICLFVFLFFFQNSRHGSYFKTFDGISHLMVYWC